jgi:hypothetical protein
LNRFEGKEIIAPRTGSPSLQALSKAKITNIKAEGGDPSINTWEANLSNNDYINPLHRHLVTEEEQIDGIIDFLAASPPVQLAHIIPAVDDLLRSQPFLADMPDLFEDNFSVEAKKALKTLQPYAYGEASVSKGFLDLLDTRLRDYSPLADYPLKSTFTEVDLASKHMAASKTLKRLLEAVPVDAQGKVDKKTFDALVNDLVARAEPFKAKFKEQHPDY